MSIQTYISQLHQYINGEETNADHVTSEFQQLIQWINQHEDLLRGKLTNANIADLGIDNLKIKNISVDKILPTIQYVLDAGRTDKTTIKWNSDPVTEGDLEFSVDGVKALTLSKIGELKVLDSVSNTLQEVATEKFIHEHIKTFINVKEFNVKGDGVTDDTVGIAEAISGTPSGKTLFFPAGTYIVSEILVNKDINIIGAGRNTIFMRKANVNSGFVMKMDINATLYNIYLGHFRIIGNKDNQTTSTGSGYGLWFNGGYNCIIEDVFVHETVGSGIVIGKTPNGTATKTLFMLNCWTYKCDGNGINIDAACVDIHVMGGDHGYSKYANIYVASPSSSIQNAVIWGGRGHGIQTGDYATSLQIRNCNIEGNEQHGVYLMTSHVQIIGCKIYDNSAGPTLNKQYDGIIISGTYTLKNILISSNIFYNHLTRTDLGNHRFHINNVNGDYVAIFGNSLRILGNGTVDKTVIVVAGLNATTDTDYSWVNSYVNAALGADTSLTASTWVDLPFTNKGVDNETEFDGTTFTARYRGVYNFNVSVMLKGQTQGLKMLRVLKNGVPIRLDVHTAASTANSWDVLKGSISILLAASETIKLQGYSGGADQTFSGVEYTSLTIKLLK